jgi:hypothetical protein
VIDIHIVIGDEGLVSGVGPGGSGKQMRKVLVNDEHVGYLAYQEYQRQGGVYEAYALDATTMIARDASAEVLALDLARRHLRRGTTRARPASASA